MSDTPLTAKEINERLAKFISARGAGDRKAMMQVVDEMWQEEPGVARELLREFNSVTKKYVKKTITT